MHACILDAGTLGTDVDLSPLLNLGMDWRIFEATEPRQTADRIRQAEIVLSNKVVLGPDVLRAAKALRFVGVLATGTNNVDLEAAAAAGVAVSNVRGYATESVVQHTLSLILALANQLRAYAGAELHAAWQKSPYFCQHGPSIQQLNGKSLTIVGMGSQGRRLASIGKALGMQVQAVTRRPLGPNPDVDRSFSHLDEALPTSQVLSFHCPLSEDTRHMLHAGNIGRLPRAALLINCARGGLVDETIVGPALMSGQLGGAAFDVATVEPPTAGHPLIALQHPAFILTPHIAWASRESRQALVQLMSDNIKQYLATGCGNLPA